MLIIVVVGTRGPQVNNAGMGVPGTPLEMDMDANEKMLQLNLHAPMHLTR